MAPDRTGRVDLLVRGGVVLTMDDAWTVFEGDVAVEGGDIVALGPDLGIRATRVLEARGNAVMPGLVNAHMHEVLDRGLFEDLPFMRWLEEFALPKDKAYEPRHMRAAALMNQLEMIQGGTTAFIDIFRFPAEAAAVAERSGLRATFAPQLIDEPLGAGETLDSSVAFIEEWRDRVPDRIRTWFGPHAIYSCHEETFARVRELAGRYGVGIHTHLAESVAEVEIVRGRTGGLTPAAYLDRLLGLGPDVVAAHCIQLDDADVELLADRDVAVAHCPTSNMKLGNGVARVLEMQGAGIRVGLGTDSVMTNNNLDMVEEMRQAGLLQKLHRRDATVMSAPSLLRLATIGSARALGLGDRIGTLEVGKAADLIVVDLHTAHAWPAFRERGGNVAEHIVWSSNDSDVLATVVEGRVLMEDRVVETIEFDEIEELVDREARDLLAKAGVLDSVIGGTR
ncbi:MAG: amidohydrolase [Actinobacteria bacterium]|nr:amidohydrolase [Actinomycetota bacterium]